VAQIVTAAHRHL